MTLPINFTNLINAIELHLVSGSGIYPNTLQSGSYTLDWFYENRTQEGLAQDTLYKPQFRIKINSFEDANAWLKPNTKTMYNVDIAVEMAYHLDSMFLKTNRTNIETKLPNDAILVQRTLTDPATMLTGSIGAETGLVSGRLTFKNYSNVKYDYTNSVASATCYFTGKVALSNSYGY